MRSHMKHAKNFSMFFACLFLAHTILITIHPNESKHMIDKKLHEVYMICFHNILHTRTNEGDNNHKTPQVTTRSPASVIGEHLGNFVIIDSHPSSVHKKRGLIISVVTSKDEHLKR